MHRSFLTIILFLTVVLNPHSVFSQAMSDISFNMLNTDFAMPEGFHEVEFVPGAYDCGDGKMSNTMFYAIANEEGSVRICIGGADNLDKYVTERIRRKYDKDFDPNKGYLMTLRDLADTIDHRIIMYDKGYLGEQYNADDGGTYVRDCNVPYMGIYPDNMVLFLFNGTSAIWRSPTFTMPTM